MACLDERPPPCPRARLPLHARLPCLPRRSPRERTRRLSRAHVSSSQAPRVGRRIRLEPLSRGWSHREIGRIDQSDHSKTFHSKTFRSTPRWTNERTRRANRRPGGVGLACRLDAGVLAQACRHLRGMQSSVCLALCHRPPSPGSNRIPCQKNVLDLSPCARKTAATMRYGGSDRGPGTSLLPSHRDSGHDVDGTLVGCFGSSHPPTRCNRWARIYRSLSGAGGDRAPPAEALGEHRVSRPRGDPGRRGGARRDRVPARSIANSTRCGANGTSSNATSIAQGRGAAWSVQETANTNGM